MTDTVLHKDCPYVIGGDTFPRPDPTKLTTEQLNVAIEKLKELLLLRMVTTDESVALLAKAVADRPGEIEKMVDHLKGFLENRLDGMDTATKLLQSIHDKQPLEISEKITSLKLLHEEKFSSIQKQFSERDVRTDQSSKDSKVAVDAALQAAKEAVGEQNKSSALAIAKSETATTKQIDQLGSLVMSQSKNFDDKLADVKDRMTRMEGEGGGKDSSTQFNFSAISVIVAVISLLIAAAVLMKHW